MLFFSLDLIRDVLVKARSVSYLCSEPSPCLDYFLISAIDWLSSKYFGTVLFSSGDWGLYIDAVDITFADLMAS